MSSPNTATPWAPMTPQAAAELFAGAAGVRWWLSGGAALDRWIGEPIRERANIDVSILQRGIDTLVDSLPPRLSAWVPDPDDGEQVIPLASVPDGDDVQPVLIHDDESGAWVLRVNVEDGTDRAWLYRRDPRLHLPWDRAVLDIDGIPTGAPEVQLVWKALRPRPEDDVDKAVVLPALSTEARAWWERAILSIHPHSSWSIVVRTPLTAAKASWNRPSR